MITEEEIFDLRSRALRNEPISKEELRQACKFFRSTRKAAPENKTRKVAKKDHESPSISMLLTQVLKEQETKEEE